MSISSAKQPGEWYDRALAYYRAGNYARCTETAQQALASDPGHVPSLLLKGTALIELGHAEEAAEALRHATRMAPDNADAWQQLGIALVMAGDRTAALEALQTTLTVRPGDAHVLMDAGNLLFTLGRTDEALQAVEQARELLPGDLSILRNLADLYGSLHRHDEARRTVLEILELRPDDVLACGDAAVLGLRLERFDEAADAFRTLRRIDPAPEHEIYAIHGLVMTEVLRRDWRRAIDLIIEATRMDRYDLTTSFLAYISSNLFGTSAAADIPLHDLIARFDAEQRDHRRLHAEVQA